jgi:GT2 family glycosyltransferase
VTAEPGISVVICTYSQDRWQDLTRSVQSVAEQAHAPLEILLVIDHNEELLARATAAWPDLRVVPNREEQGLSGGRNTGLSLAKGEIVAFLDDDASAERDWLAELGRAYHDPTVLGVGGASVPSWDEARPAWFPREFDWVVGCSYRGLPEQEAEVRNLIGSNMSFRTAPMRQISGFRADLGRIGKRPTGCEETELCIRLVDHHPGHRLLYRPGAKVLHRVPAERGTWRYFRARCFAEGQSKAIVSRLVGRRRGLGTERRYASRVLPAAAAGAAWNGIRLRPASDLGRALAIVAGLAITTLGYAWGSLFAPRPSR